VCVSVDVDVAVVWRFNWRWWKARFICKNFTGLQRFACSHSKRSIAVTLQKRCTDRVESAMVPYRSVCLMHAHFRKSIPDCR
jgi:hypothetical protein